MKKLLPFLLLAFLSGYALLLSGCDDEEKIESLSYEEYQLPMQPQLEGGDDRAIVINDIKSFRHIFSAYPELEAIDFDTHTLVLAKGTANSGIHEIKKEISRSSDNKYQFTITIEQNLATVMSPWGVAYILPKTSPSNIMLFVGYK